MTPGGIGHHTRSLQTPENGNQRRSTAYARAKSTGWGSLVRARYRPFSRFFFPPGQCRVGDTVDELNGPMVNQADFLPDLANPSFQDNANEAIHRFIS